MTLVLAFKQSLTSKNVLVVIFAGQKMQREQSLRSSAAGKLILAIKQSLTSKNVLVVILRKKYRRCPVSFFLCV